MRKWGIGIVLLVTCLLLFIVYDGYRMQETLIGQSDASPILKTMRTDGQVTKDETWFKQTSETQQWSKDGLVRFGRYLPVDGSKQTVLLVPDEMMFSQTGVYALARYYHEADFNVLLIERRGQDRSGGVRNYGWLDRLDVLEWTKRLLAENGDDTRIVYHGLGVGASTVLLASGETVPTQVRAIVAEGAYARLDDWFSLLADEQILYPALPSLTVASMWNKGEQDFFYGDVSVTRQATKSRVPTMFIHGLKDDLVPVRMMYELYQAKTGLKQLYPVRDAGHDETYTMDPDNYEKRLRLFLQPYLREM